MVASINVGRGLLKEFFYPVARSATLGSGPMERHIFGHAIALFRDSTGLAHAVDAACPHRGANLAAGRVVDGCLECPYHGWRFEGGGRCVLVPSHPDKSIPVRSNARVNKVVEQQGIIWVHVGQRPALLEPPTFAAAVDPSMRVVSIEQVMQGPFEWWLENFLDFSHVPFVHRKSFGGKHPAVQTHPVERRADEFGFRARAAARYDYGLLARIFHGSLRPYTEVLRFDVTLPGAVYIELDMGNKHRQALALLATPQTDQTTRVIQMVWRNYLKWIPYSDAIGRSFMRAVLREDERIIEQSIVKERLPDQAVMAADGPGQELCRLLRLWQDRQPQRRNVDADLADL